VKVRELRARDVVALDLVLQGVGVVRDPLLQLLVDVEDDRERGQRHHDAEHGSHLRGVRADATSHVLPEQGDREHRHCGAERIAEGHEDRPPAKVDARGVRSDRAEDGPCAGDEDEAEAGAEQEAAAEVPPGPTSAEEVQRPLEPDPHLREDERRGEQEQEPNGEIAEEVLRQPEVLQDPGCEERESGEARDQPGDDS
jgi:hypothetical protein